VGGGETGPLADHDHAPRPTLAASTATCQAQHHQQLSQNPGIGCACAMNIGTQEGMVMLSNGPCKSAGIPHASKAGLGRLSMRSTLLQRINDKLNKPLVVTAPEHSVQGTTLTDPCSTNSIT
jgi:hypothetical protein